MPFTRILHAINEILEAKKSVAIEHMVVLESKDSNEDFNMVVKFDLDMSRDGLLRHYFFGLSRGNKIFQKNALEIVGRTTVNTDAMLMKYKPNKWQPVGEKSQEMYDEILHAFSNDDDAILPPKAYKHTTVFGDKKMLKDFLCKLRNGSMKSINQYSAYVNKKFSNSDYLTFSQKKPHFKNLELQHKIDSAA